MLIQATGLAFLAALSPTALLVTAVYLGSSRPKAVATFYLIGASAMSLVMGIVLLVVLRGLDLDRADHRVPRYGLRLGLGVLLVIGAVVVATRRPKPEPKDRPGIVDRMVADPSPLSALLVGLLVFAPGATFLATIQVIATARAGVELTAAALVIVVVINVALIWLPICMYLVSPERTTRQLSRFNGWLRVNSRRILAWVLSIAGVLMIVNGLYGLAK